MRRLAGSLLLAVIASTAQAQAPPSAESMAPRIEHTLKRAVRVIGIADSAFSLADRMKYWHVPGVSIAVVDDFRIVYARGFGVAEYGGSRPVDTTTLFLAGSISKPVFATGALRLVEQGKLSLDEDVNAKLTSWRVPESRFTEKEKVTLRRILTHSAGLTVWGFPGYASGRPVPTVPQLLDGTTPANTGAVRNDTIPGVRWLYSGGGITIAQLLATDVTGESFPALMKRLVLEPAGMTRSTFENPLPAARHPEAASGHERIDTPVPGRFHTYPEMAAAGLWTTAPELARWALAVTRAYNGAPNAILSPAMAQRMVFKHQPTGARGGNGFWGLGVGVAGDADSIAFRHGGRDEGFVADVIMWPKLGRGVFILTNGVSGPLLGEIRAAFGELYGHGGPTRTDRATIPVAPVSLQGLVGRYESPGLLDTLRFDVALSGGALQVYGHAGKRQFQLFHAGEDRFFDANAGTTFAFERDSTSASGPARVMRIGLGPNARRAQQRSRPIR
jgi:CubicO group peptidase (beta-lactamase class C family)